MKGGVKCRVKGRVKGQTAAKGTLPQNAAELLLLWVLVQSSSLLSLLSLSYLMSVIVRTGAVTN